MGVSLLACPFCGGPAKSTYGGATPDDWPERHGCEACWVFRETAEGWNTRAEPRTQRPSRPEPRREPQHAGLTPEQERGAAFVLPFGSYRNKSLGEVARTSKGRDYLAWLLDQEWLKPDTREFLELFRGPAAGEYQGRASEADY